MILDALKIVQEETNSRVNLVRTPDRNLVRNSGQYWKALGLLEEAHGRIIVSPFGQLLAEGKITQIEFASTIVKTLELPNERIEDTSEWDKVGLKIKPLELMLEILSKMGDRYGFEESYITPLELVNITIPLAGNKSIINDHVNAIIQYRKGIIKLSNWPDCAPSANDQRMAREFLLFLYNYGFCNVLHNNKNNNLEKYFISSISKSEIVGLRKLNLLLSANLDDAVKQIKMSQIPANIERKKVNREILERPYQIRFRKNILSAYNSTCVITGVNLSNILEASHIVPVRDNGSDQIENGLCLRADIHQLFDSGHMRITPKGIILLSDEVKSQNSYSSLPNSINIPKFVSRDNLKWRLKYN